MHDSRQDKVGRQDEKTRAPDARWDKQAVGPFPERPQPSTLDDGPVVGLRSGVGQPGSKWREDGDRVLPRRDVPAPTRYSCLLTSVPSDVLWSTCSTFACSNHGLYALALQPMSSSLIMLCSLVGICKQVGDRGTSLDE